jgi:hypothetical protein
MAGLLGTASTGVTSQAGATQGMAGRGAIRHGAVQGAKENENAKVWHGEPGPGMARLGLVWRGQAWHGLGGVVAL